MGKLQMAGPEKVTTQDKREVALVVIALNVGSMGRESNEAIGVENIG